MTCRLLGRLLIASAALALLPLPGCSGDNDKEAAKEAEAALGLQGAEGTKSEKRDVLVIDEKKVVDAKTGKVLKDDKTVTPVTVEAKHRTDVNADVGESQAAGTPPK